MSVDALRSAIDRCTLLLVKRAHVSGTELLQQQQQGGWGGHTLTVSGTELLQQQGDNQTQPSC